MTGQTKEELYRDADDIRIQLTIKNLAMTAAVQKEGHSLSISGQLPHLRNGCWSRPSQDDKRGIL